MNFDTHIVVHIVGHCGAHNAEQHRQWLDRNESALNDCVFVSQSCGQLENPYTIHSTTRADTEQHVTPIGFSTTFDFFQFVTKFRKVTKKTYCDGTNKFKYVTVPFPIEIMVKNNFKCF